MLLPLMFIIMFMTFVYGLVGMQLFGYTLVNPDGSYPRLNFNSFRNSVVTLFQVITLDDWVSVVCDGLQSTTLTSRILIIPYLCSFVIIECYVLLNLFVAAVVEKFELTNDVKEADQRRNKRNKTETAEAMLKRKAEVVNKVSRRVRELVRVLTRKKITPEEAAAAVAAGKAAAAHESKDPKFGQKQLVLQVWCHACPPHVS